MFVLFVNNSFAVDENKAVIVLKGIADYSIPETIIGTNVVFNHDRNIQNKHLKNNILIYRRDNTVEMNPYMQHLARNLNLAIVRYPGGQEGEHYHWGEGIGPIKNRRKIKDSYGRKQRQYLGVLEIYEFTKSINAQILFTINYSTASIQEIVNLVEFCNTAYPDKIEDAWTIKSYRYTDKAPAGYFAWLRGQYGYKAPLDIKYWEIGNEIYFTKDNKYIYRAHQYAQRMKTIDKSIKIGITADPLLQWNKKTILNNILKIDRKIIDWLSIHLYSYPRKMPLQTTFTSVGESSRKFTVNRNGRYTICILAKGDQFLGSPVMRVKLDDHQMDFNVGTNDWQDYCIEQQLEKGIHNILLSFINDIHVPNVGDRNLHVWDVVIDNETRESIWRTKQVEYNILFGNNQAIEQQLAEIKKSYPKLDIYITEASPGYGLDQKKFDRVNSLESAKLKSAIWYAGLINTVMRQRIKTLNQFPFNGRLWGFNLIREGGEVSPIYHVMKLYSKHVNNNLVDISIMSPKFRPPFIRSEPLARGSLNVNYIDAVATIDKIHNILNITIVNRHENKNLNLDVKYNYIYKSLKLNEYTLISGIENVGLEASGIVNKSEIIIRRVKDITGNNVVIPAHSVMNLSYTPGKLATTVH